MNRYLVQASIWGISGGFACFIWFLAVYYSGVNPFYSVPQSLVILLQAAVVYFGMMEFRDRQISKEFSFGEGLLCGLLITLFLTVISSVVVYGFVQYFYPEMVATHILELKKYLITNKQLLVKESSIEVFEGNLRNVNQVSAFTLGVDEFIWKMIRGIMLSILAALILRRKVA
ncbi:MAG: DUF4199 domain-containing protein [Cytophagales bacterium]